MSRGNLLKRIGGAALFCLGIVALCCASMLVNDCAPALGEPPYSAQPRPAVGVYQPCDPANRPMMAVQCGPGGCGEATWANARPLAWQYYAQGEYAGHARATHVAEYRLRVDDLLECVYRVTREETSRPYQLNVGDEIRIESLTDAEGVNMNAIVQPDGTVTLRLLGQVRAVGRTVAQLRAELEKAYTKFYTEPAITVMPIKVNTKLEDLRATVDSRYGAGGQSRQARVTPEGTIALPAVGSVPAQGLTLDELKRELDERYRQEVEGIEVTPVLIDRAARYIYVLGEVRVPGRYEMTGPMTAMQAISMGGGWNVGANLRQVVVFRRDDDWRLMATKLDLRGALLGKSPCPADEIWLNDSDLVVVPKSGVLIANDWIDLVFRRGIYGVLPFQASVSYNYSQIAAP